MQRRENRKYEKTEQKEGGNEDKQERGRGRWRWTAPTGEWLNRAAVLCKTLLHSAHRRLTQIDWRNESSTDKKHPVTNSFHKHLEHFWTQQSEGGHVGRMKEVVQNLLSRPEEAEPAAPLFFRQPDTNWVSNCPCGTETPDNRRWYKPRPLSESSFSWRWRKISEDRGRLNESQTHDVFLTDGVGTSGWGELPAQESGWWCHSVYTPQMLAAGS